MKKYVIIGLFIGNIGGAQLHYKHKLRECEKRGYQCCVITTEQNYNIKVGELCRYENNVIEEFNQCPYLFTKRKIKKILNKAIKIIDYHQDDEIVIESSILYGGVWGELLAKECNGKNLLYLLDEKFPMQNVKKCLDFLLYKYDRYELANITKDVMHKMFLPYKDILLEECCSLSALSFNDPEDVLLPNNIENKKNMICIGVFGRLGKEFAKTAVNGIVDFCSCNSNQQFYVLLIGGECEQSKQYESALKKLSNVEVCVTGRLYPIPKKLFEILDVCISSAGAAIIMAQNVPTISIDGISNKAIGILGYDTYSVLTNNDNPNPKTIYEYLHMILFGNINTVDKYRKFKEKNGNRERTIQKHFDFITYSNCSKEYYIKRIKPTYRQWIKHFMPAKIIEIVREKKKDHKNMRK